MSDVSNHIGNWEQVLGLEMAIECGDYVCY